MYVYISLIYSMDQSIRERLRPARDPTLYTLSRTSETREPESVLQGTQRYTR